MSSTDDRIGVLYLAPWVDYGGSDKGTIDLFRWLDRDRFRISLITTQPSLNRKLAEVARYADEVWPLADLMAGNAFPTFILEFIQSREIRVLHVMNSRLGFNLLPDLLNLEEPPAVVVQLHVEEEDRSGYVRYVTTRYGNLVDAFSVTSMHLAESIAENYDVPRAKCRLIYTGVDADREFSPEHVIPVDCLEDGPIHILFAGRLVPQKDPLLMVKVASALKTTGIDFRIHSVGEGVLKERVRGELSAQGLEQNVLLHGPKPSIAPWLAGSDLALMTSAFEGVPYVVYEAMAMGVPTIAPALPGVVELMPRDCGRLVTPRDNVAGYVAALSELAANPDTRVRLGLNARMHAQEHFSLQEMAQAHGDLYDEVMQKHAFDPVRNGRQHPEPIRCAHRGMRGNPLVSVIVPCFDHGRYLPQCLESIQNQTYPAIETIVVDDASSDPQTRRLLDSLERASEFTVIRLAENVGPGAARNIALGAAKGRYILPVDADNLLVPGAIAHLVNQLQNAGEQIGYVYPNLQFFGNRSDYFEAPEFNLHQLLESNYCDTCCLLDRDVFDAGVEYLEKVKVGHEDWDLVLTLGEHEVFGEPARTKTVLFRKHGFTRSDVVEHGRHSFYARIRELHPSLYKAAPAIKARWSPALSVIALQTIPAGSDAQLRLERQLSLQTLTDCEVLVRSEREWRRQNLGPNVRRLAPGLAGSAAEALRVGLEAARGRFVLVTEGTGTSVFNDRTFAEKILRILQAEAQAAGLALVDAGQRGLFAFRSLGEEDEPFDWRPHALAWPIEHSRGLFEFERQSIDDDQVLLDFERLSIDEPLRDLARAFGSGLQWRHFPSPPARPKALTPERLLIQTNQAPPQRESEAAERRARMSSAPVLSDAKPVIRRLANQVAWAPPMTLPLARHRGPDGRRIVLNERAAPAGFIFEHDLGVLNLFRLPGTAQLISHAADHGANYAVCMDERDPPSPARSLGHVELAPLPLLEPLLLALDPVTGQRVLVAGEDDPLITHVEPIKTLGWIEPYPIKPKRAPGHAFAPGLAGLVRGIDYVRRRHVYGIGAIPEADLAGELGALETQYFPGLIGVWLTPDGFVVTDDHAPRSGRPPLRAVARWSLAPARWRGFSTVPARGRAVARRLYESARRLSFSAQAPVGLPANGDPLGYLLPEPTRHSVPLYSALHPVTYDQLLTTSDGQAADMGFAEISLLGHLIAEAPLTGSLALVRRTVPWASRFGERVREA
jgi:glycosyltransferase involved in cell wall biosynthesis